MVKFLVTSVVVLICLFLMALLLCLMRLGHYPAAAVSVPSALPVSGPNQKEKEEALPGRDRGGRGVTHFCRPLPAAAAILCDKQ